MATRNNKKKAADDAKLLANRIALLKLEEKKAWKKIEETRKKALQVQSIRQRNEEERAKRDTIRQAREEEEEQRLKMNEEMRTQTRQNINQ